MQERQPNAMRKAQPVKILLTGASGYIGLHILQDSLKAGHQVTALVRVPAKLGPFLGHPLLKNIEMDLSNTPSLESALDGHDVCIHAALVGPPAFPEGAFGSHNRLPEMVNAAMENQPIEVLRGDGRQFIDVTSLAKFIRLLTTTQSPYPTYICVDRDLITWEQVARLVGTCLQSSSDIRVLPHELQNQTPYF